MVVGSPLVNLNDVTNNGLSKEIVYTHGHNGRPGCQTIEEINRPWRNNFDPTRFWFCIEIGANAIEISCPTGSGFISENLMCVPWSTWTWLTPYDPLTMA